MSDFLGGGGYPPKNVSDPPPPIYVKTTSGNVLYKHWIMMEVERSVFSLGVDHFLEGRGVSDGSRWDFDRCHINCTKKTKNKKQKKKKKKKKRKKKKKKKEPKKNLCVQLSNGKGDNHGGNNKVGPFQWCSIPIPESESITESTFFLLESDSESETSKGQNYTIEFSCNRNRNLLSFPGIGTGIGIKM